MSCLTLGCIGEQQDLNAIPHLVRPVRSLADADGQSAPQLEQPHLAHLAPRRDHPRREEPRALPERPYPQPLRLIPVYSKPDNLPARRRADLRS